MNIFYTERREIVLYADTKRRLRGTQDIFKNVSNYRKLYPLDFLRVIIENYVNCLILDTTFVFSNVSKNLRNIGSAK